MENIFKNCYCGCKLDSTTLRWKFKMFDDPKEADKYALNDGDNSKATKLLVIPCVYGKDVSILKSMAKKQLYFGLDFEKDEK